MALGIAVCFIFFLCVEAVLRVFGIPAKSLEEDPFVGFSALKPLFTVKDGRASVSPERLKYFNAADFPIKKEPGTFRVFCFGGSTTYGHPFDGRSAFPRWLEELLKASCPEKRFEVMNLGGISYASYRIVPLIKETLKYQPDLMIIYTGHNEFLERRTYAGLFDQGPAVITVKSLLERLHLYQGLRRLLEPLTKSLVKDRSKETGTTAGKVGGDPPITQPGMAGQRKTVLKQEVQAILDQSGGLELYHRDDAFAAGVLQHFAHNLEAMAALCRTAGVPLVLVEPESNLKDFSPFKSESSPGLDSAKKRELQGKRAQAAEFIEQGDFEKALLLLEKVTRDDPLYAESHFLMGKALLGLERYSEAHDSFVRAKDLDVCPLRATSEIMAKIRKVAQDQKSIFISFKEFLDGRPPDLVDKSGIPGNEGFLDHVHPTIRGHQALAEKILEQITQHGLVGPSRNLTTAERSEIYAKIMSSFDDSFLATRDLNLAKTLMWAGKRQEARPALNRAAKVMETDPEIHKMLGSYLLDDRRYEDAIKEYTKAVEYSGNDPPMVFSLGVAYYRSGLKDRARQTYQELVDSGAPIAEAYSNLALLHLEEGRTREALKVIAVGAERHRDSAPVLGTYGLALAVSGRPADGIAWMLRALEIDPNNPEYLYNLAGMYCLSGKREGALRTLDLAVKRGYANAEKMASDGVFQSLRGDPVFAEIIKRMR